MATTSQSDRTAIDYIVDTYGFDDNLRADSLDNTDLRHDYFTVDTGHGVAVFSHV